MPIYEYRCKKCGSHFEKRQSVSEEPLKVCEHCEGELEKQWSLSGFAFKGEGWYVTDYSKKGSGAKEPEKSSPPESTSSTESASNSTESASNSTESASKPKSESTAKSD